jgi:Flp pilus assembly protein TadG
VSRLWLRLRREQAGQASVEFAGVLFWLLLAAFAVWQMLLVAWTVNQASNAARTASRVEGREGDGAKAGRNALSPGLRRHASVELSGEKATVRVRIPILLPGLDSDGMRASRSAELPDT